MDNLLTLEVNHSGGEPSRVKDISRSLIYVGGIIGGTRISEMMSSCCTSGLLAGGGPSFPAQGRTTDPKSQTTLFLHHTANAGALQGSVGSRRRRLSEPSARYLAGTPRHRCSPYSTRGVSNDVGNRVHRRSSLPATVSCSSTAKDVEESEAYPSSLSALRRRSRPASSPHLEDVEGPDGSKGAQEDATAITDHGARTEAVAASPSWNQNYLMDESGTTDDGEIKMDVGASPTLGDTTGDDVATNSSYSSTRSDGVESPDWAGAPPARSDDLYELNMQLAAYAKDAQWEKAIMLLRRTREAYDRVQRGGSGPDHVESDPVEPNVVSYNNVITACANAKKQKRAEGVFAEMTMERGIRPNVFTYGALISACAKRGNWQDAVKYLEVSSRPLSVEWPKTPKRRV